MFNSLSRNIRLAALTGAAIIAFAATPAVAAETSSNLGVSATVSSNCAISTSPVAFPSFDATLGAAVDATGSISVTCTSGTTWTAAAAAGAGTGASLTVRKMTKGSDLLNYALYTDSGRTTVWGDGTTGATVGDTGSGSAQSKIIYGQIAASQSAAPSGAYADTVSVTVTY